MKKILLLACESGGANTLIPLIPGLKKTGFRISLFAQDSAGPQFKAAGFWAKDINRYLHKFGKSQADKFLKEQKVDLVITGANCLAERYLWAAAEKLGIPSFAILDNWMNYGIRFSRYPVRDLDKYQRKPSLDFLPTKLFVMDELAKKECLKVGVPASRIVLSGQPYFETIRANAKRISSTDLRQFKRRLGIPPKSFLVTYASQPIAQAYGSQGPRYLGYTEQTVFSCLFKKLRSISDSNNQRITLVIKPHPQEDVAVWENVCAHNSSDQLKVLIMKQGNIWELIKASDLVCGISSMFLIESVIFNRPTLSIQIGREKPLSFVLEQRGILKPVVDEATLLRRLRNVILTRQKPRYSFDTVSNPSLKIINYLRKHYAQIVYPRRKKIKDK